MEYILAFALTILITKSYQSRNCTKWIYCIWATMPISLVAGLRDISIGADTHYTFETFRDVLFYKNLREAIISLCVDSDYEELYVTWNYIVSLFSDNFSVYLTITYIFVFSFVLICLRNNKNSMIWWIGIWILCFVFYRESLNTIRQFCACVICLYSFHELMQKKYIYAILIVIIAYGFHHSAPIFLILILLKYLYDQNPQLMGTVKFKMLIIGSIVFAFFGLSYYLDFLMSIGLTMNKYESYLSDDVFGASLPVSMLALWGENLVFFYIIKYKNRYVDQTILNFFEYIFLLSLIICFTSLISTYTIRLGYYFYILNIMIVPYMLKNYKCPQALKFLHLFFYVFFWYMTTIVANLSTTYPYKSCF